jgi:TM2 domain-containing membrane protein YozV
MAGRYSDRSRLVALLLCWFLGYFGAHRFYVGKMGTGLLMIVTLGGFGLWWLFDLVMIVIGQFTDVEGKLVFKWMEDGSH